MGLMRIVAELLFYGYSGLLVVAGAWGVIGGRSDQRKLFGLDVGSLGPVTDASLVSQYRFLRAIEAGFGTFAIIFHDEIYTLRAFNRIFLGAMAAGVLARIISLLVDGKPKAIFYFFLVSEAVGVVVIFLYTRNLLGD
jgi:hypothetical protein